MTEPSPRAETDKPSSKAWPIAFGVVTVLLIIAVLFIPLRDDDSVETSTVGTTSTTAVTTSTSTTTTSESGPSSSASEVCDLECTAADLLAAIDPGVVAEGAQVSEFQCTPSTLGDAANAYAWARVTAPDVDPIVVLYMGYAGEDPGAPVAVDWQVITYGSAVTCDEFTPIDACDQLPGVPRQ